LDIYVAPNTGGESFGIILTEAMAAGVPIVASDIPAFRSLLDEGRYGRLFENENSEKLATSIIELLRKPELRADFTRKGLERAERFDWSQVSDEIMNVYLHARGEDEKVRLVSETRPWNRFFTREDE
jgi:phosphatidylinositol alpha-mannosyltransferase